MYTLTLSVLCVSIIFFILIRVPNQYESDFSRDLLKSVAGTSSSQKISVNNLILFVWALILLFLGEYILGNFIFGK